jgi:carbon monoxide dehydrogenase subunit G
MRLESKIIIHCPPEEVWKFLGDLQNIAKWDRGVASAAQTSAGQTGVGSRFDTLARGGEPETGRMSYRISETGNDRCVIELDGFEGNARFFKSARWIFQIEPNPDGSVLTCATDFVLRLRYFFMAPVLYVMKGAIARDLRGLKKVLEQRHA